MSLRISPEKDPKPSTINTDLVDLVNTGVEKLKSTAGDLLSKGLKTLDKAETLLADSAKKLKEFTQTKRSPTHVYSPRGEYLEMRVIKFKEFDLKQMEKIIEEMNKTPGRINGGESREAFIIKDSGEMFRFQK